MTFINYTTKSDTDFYTDNAMSCLVEALKFVDMDYFLARFYTERAFQYILCLI